MVGLASSPPLVGPSPCKHGKCGQAQWVAHTASKCSELVAQRQSLTSALSAESATMTHEFAWGYLTDARKLAQSFCPSRVSTLSVHEACTFYSASARAWRKFYEGAGEALGGTVKSSEGNRGWPSQQQRVGVWGVAPPPGEGLARSLPACWADNLAPTQGHEPLIRSKHPPTTPTPSLARKTRPSTQNYCPSLRHPAKPKGAPRLSSSGHQNVYTVI